MNPNPKEKAKELVEKMFSNMPKYLQGKIGSETAKQCALIYIDDMLKEYLFIHDKVLIKHFDSHEVIGIVYNKYLFLEEVKQEIEKL